LNLVDEAGNLQTFPTDPQDLGAAVGELQTYLESTAASNNMSQFLSVQMAVAKLNVMQSGTGNLGTQYVDAASLLPFIGASDSQPIASNYITGAGYITVNNLIALASRLVSSYTVCQQNGTNSAAFQAEAAVETLLAAVNLDASVYLQQTGQLTWD
jgi:hypothetical protein